MYHAAESDHSKTLIHKDEGPELNSTDAFWCVIETLPKQRPVPTSIIKLGLLSQHLGPKPDSYKTKVDDEAIESTATAEVPSQTLTRVRWVLSNHCNELPSSKKKKIGKLCEISGLNLPPNSVEYDDAQDHSNPNNIVNELLIKKGSQDIVCEYCGNEYQSTNALNGHLSHCNERQTENNEYQKNIENNFNTKKEYVCESCEESFTTKSKLRVHKKRNCDKKNSSEKESNKRPAFGKKIRKDKGSERVSGRNPFADPEKLKDTGIHQGGN